MAGGTGGFYPTIKTCEPWSAAAQVKSKIFLGKRKSASRPGRRGVSKTRRAAGKNQLDNADLVIDGAPGSLSPCTRRNPAFHVGSYEKSSLTAVLLPDGFARRTTKVSRELIVADVCLTFNRI